MSYPAGPKCPRCGHAIGQHEYKAKDCRTCLAQHLKGRRSLAAVCRLVGAPATDPAEWAGGGWAPPEGCGWGFGGDDPDDDSQP